MHAKLVQSKYVRKSLDFIFTFAARSLVNFLVWQAFNLKQALSDSEMLTWVH